MDKFGTIILAGLIIFGVGCRSTDTKAIFAHCPWGDAVETKARLDGYKHVLLVCICEDHWEDRGPREYALHHFRATVVCSYKGEWHTSQRVAFVHGVDAPARTPAGALDGRYSVASSNAGNLMFLFTNDHTDAEIGFDTGDFLGYDPELERVIRFVYPERKTP